MQKVSESDEPVASSQAMHTSEVIDLSKPGELEVPRGRGGGTLARREGVSRSIYSTSGQGRHDVQDGGSAWLKGSGN